jgi:hypothetical protein
MTRAPLALLLPLLALLLAAGPLGAQAVPGAVLYVSRFLSADPGDIRLADLVHAPADLSPQQKEAFARSIAVLGAKVLIVPASLYMDTLEAAVGTDWIVVGARTIVAPRSLPEAEAYLLDRLADYLFAQGLAGAGTTELAVEQNLVRGTPPQEGNPVFQAQKGARGVTEVSFTLSAPAGGSVAGKVSVANAASPANATGGLAPGAIVKVVFRKGPITIEMPGKAAGAARVGERVNVYVSESQKSFNAQVVDGKAVEVDLP